MKNKLLKFSSQRNIFFKPNQNTFKIPIPPLKYIKQIQSTRNLKLIHINNSIKINKHNFDSEKNKMIEIGKNNNNEIINYDYYEEKKSLNKNYKRNYLYENYNQKFDTEKKFLPITTLPNINRINITNNNNIISNNNNIEENLKNTNKKINVKKIKINDFNKKILLPNLNFEIKKKKIDKKDEEQKIYNKKTIEIIDDNNDKSFYEEVNNILLTFKNKN